MENLNKYKFPEIVGKNNQKHKWYINYTKNKFIKANSKNTIITYFKFKDFNFSCLGFI